MEEEREFGEKNEEVVGGRGILFLFPQPLPFYTPATQAKAGGTEVLVGKISFFYERHLPELLPLKTAETAKSVPNFYWSTQIFEESVKSSMIFQLSPQTLSECTLYLRSGVLFPPKRMPDRKFILSNDFYFYDNCRNLRALIG